MCVPAQNLKIHERNAPNKGLICIEILQFIKNFETLCQPGWLHISTSEVLGLEMHCTMSGFLREWLKDSRAQWHRDAS